MAGKSVCRVIFGALLTVTVLFSTVDLSPHASSSMSLFFFFFWLFDPTELMRSLWRIILVLSCPSLIGSNQGVFYQTGRTIFSIIPPLLSAGTGSSVLSALQNRPSAFWPCRSKMEKHLQAISVLQWVITFLAMGEEEEGRRGGYVCFSPHPLT